MSCKLVINETKLVKSISAAGKLFQTLAVTLRVILPANQQTDERRVSHIISLAEVLSDAAGGGGVGVEGYTCPSTLGLRYSDCPPRPRSCRDIQKTEGGGDAWLPADVDCLPGCYCVAGKLFDDSGQCGTVQQCPCYHPYTGQAVAPGNKADLLCGEW